MIYERNPGGVNHYFTLNLWRHVDPLLKKEGKRIGVDVRPDPAPSFISTRGQCGPIFLTVQP